MRLRTLFLVALSLAALVGGLWYWRKTQAAADRRLAAWEDHERTRATEAILEKRIDWPRATLPLAEFAAVIAKNSGLAVEIDRIALEAEGRDLPSIRIDIPRGTLPIGSVLRLGLSPHDLCYDQGDRRLTITTPTVSHDRNRLQAVVYPLPQPELASSEVDEGRWYELVVHLLETSDWDATGGQGHCEPVPGGVVVVQTAEVHREIRHLFRSLSELSSPPASVEPVPLLLSTDSESVRNIRTALRQPTGVDFQGVPLSEAVSQLAWQHNVPLVVNAAQLIEAGISPDVKVTIESSGRSLKSLLRRMLDQLEITFMLRDGALVVTTYDDAEAPENMIIVAYPVHDLVEDQGARDYDPLIDLITTIVAPEQWQDGTGPNRSVSELDGWLLIAQTWEAHAEIERLLAQLGRSLGNDEDESVAAILDEPPIEQRIRVALDRTFALKFVENPLSEVAAQLSQSLGVPVDLALRELADLPIERRVPITCDLPAAPAWRQLQRLLDPLDLSYVIQHEAVLITTREAAESPENMLIRSYDVRALTDLDIGLCSSYRLQEFIQKLVLPGSWSDVGGPASMREFHGLLAVSHNDGGHRSLVRLLAVLEEHCLQPPDDAGPATICLDENPEQRRIEQLLRENARVDFCGEPLDRALHRLALDHDLPLVFGEDLLTAWSEIDWPPVSLSTARYTLGGILDRMLKPEWLVYEVHDGVLHVTRRIDPAVRMEVRLYRVDGLGGARLPQDLIAAVKPEQWDHGGSFDAALLPTGWLIVATDWARHQRVAEWFEEQRTGRKPRRAIERLDFDVEYPFDPFAVPSVRLPRERPDPPLETNP